MRTQTLKKESAHVSTEKRARISSTKLETLLAGLMVDYGALSELTAVVYRKAFLVEQAYADECLENKPFHEKYPRFWNYMEDVMPVFDIGEYYRYKPLIVFDKCSVFNSLTNAAFKLLGTKIFIHGRNEFHPMAEKVLLSIPEDKITNDVEMLKILKDVGIYKRGKRTAKVSDIRSTKHTAKTLAKMSKTDLVELCLRLQKSAEYYKTKASIK